MKHQRPHSSAVWFFLAALITSEPWSLLLNPPADLAARYSHSVGTIWRTAFFGTSVAGSIGYAAGMALFRSYPSRMLSAAVGAAFGFAVVAATRLPPFSGADFEPLVLASAAGGLVLGLVFGFRERRANHALKRTCAE